MKNKFKGKKFYGIIRDDKDAEPAVIYKTIEGATRGLDNTYVGIVELTVTRIFTRERDLKEIETEI